MHDLEVATLETYQDALRIPASSELFQALRDSQPISDHNSIWKAAFRPQLERIAAHPRRRAQAMECRLLFTECVEKYSVLWVLTRLEDADIEAALTYLLFPQHASTSPDEVAFAIRKQYAYYMLDKMALSILYASQFNSLSLQLDSFSSTYDAMCKMNWEFSIKQIMASEPFHESRTQSGADFKSEFDAISAPLVGRLRNLKEKYRLNLCLLTPSKPDNRAYLDFLQTYSDQADKIRALFHAKFS